MFTSPFMGTSNNISLMTPHISCQGGARGRACSRHGAVLAGRGVHTLGRQGTQEGGVPGHIV